MAVKAEQSAVRNILVADGREPFVSPESAWEIMTTGPRDTSGLLYNPARLFQLLDILGEAGIDKNYIFSAYENPEAILYSAGLDDNQFLHYGSSIMGTSAILRRIAGSPMSRRTFIRLSGILSVGAVLAACGPKDQRTPTEERLPEETVVEECIIAPPVSDIPESIPLSEYERLDTHRKADFLLRGGLTNEGFTIHTSDRELFYQQMAIEAQEVLVASFADLMGEDAADLDSRVIVVDSEEGMSAVIERYGKTEPEAGALGVSFVGEDGKQVSVIFLHRIVDFNRDFENENPILGSVTLTNNFIHEMNHLGAGSRPFSDENKGDLRKWIKEFRNDVQEVTDIIEPPGDLHVYYRLQGDDSSLARPLLDPGIWSEISREFSERGYLERLNSRTGQDLVTVSYLPDYLGQRLLRYFHRKIGIQDEQVLNFINSFRKGGNLNFHDYISMYTESAGRVNPALNEKHIIYALNLTTALWVLVRNTAASGLSDLEKFCEMQKHYTDAELLIDRLVEEGVTEFAAKYEHLPNLRVYRLARQPFCLQFPLSIIQIARFPAF